MNLVCRFSNQQFWNTTNQLLIHAVSTEVIDIGLIRHTLRRSRSFKVNELVPTVLENFGRLGPVIPDVFLSLQGVTTPELVGTHLNLLRNLLGSSLVHSSRLGKVLDVLVFLIASRVRRR